MDIPETKTHQESPTGSSDSFINRWETQLVGFTLAAVESGFGTGVAYGGGHDEMAIAMGASAALSSLLAISSGFRNR